MSSASRTLRGRYDLTVVGGGIIGLATARRVLLQHPKLRVCVVEKEKELASHQSHRNSGVVHCGIYYKKGSLKSKFCIKGSRMIKDYCETKGLAFKQCGKLIVATQQEELEVLHALHANATANRIEDIELISPEKIRRIQPGCNAAIEAIWSPNTAIVDWRQVALSYAEDFQQLGGEIITNFTVSSFQAEQFGRRGVLTIENAKQEGEAVETNSVVNCAGLFSDYFARQTCNNEHPKVVPFKGNYLLLGDRLSDSIKTNIYPVPNPKLPFLGVHITPRIDGSVIVGPTSLLTLGYERYHPDVPLQLVQLYHILVRSGLWRLVVKKDNFKAGLYELWKLYSKSRLTKDVQALLPDVKQTDLVQTNFCGIRAQVVSKDGSLVDDFLFETGTLQEFDRILHVRNCPSPAATSSLAIAERVVSILEERFL